MWITSIKLLTEFHLESNVVRILFFYPLRTTTITFNYLNAIKWLPPMMGLGGTNICNFTLANDKNNKEVVSD